MIFLTFVVALIIFAVFHFWKQRQNDGTPPGPIALPLVGHLLQLGDQSHLKINEWKEKYGPIMSIRFGSVPVVILSDSKSIREAFSSPAMCGRPQFGSFSRIPEAFNGVALSDPAENREQRQFIIPTLKQFGYGKSIIEESIQEELDTIIEQIEKDVQESLSSGQPMSLHKRLSLGPLNTIWKIVMQDGKTKEYAEVDTLMTAIRKALASDGILPELANFIPIIRRLFPSVELALDKKMKNFGEVYKFTQAQIDSHSKTRIPGQPRDFTDAYLDKVDETTNPKSSFHKNRDCLKSVLGDFFIPATEDMSTAFKWLFLHLIRNDKVQEKMYQEIIGQTGNSRRVTLTDRPQLPYTDAVIHESLRLTPTGFPHMATEDVRLGGYLIKRNTWILTNIHAVHRDPVTWPDPHTFEPKRFLNDQGKMKGHYTDYMPFSVGNRSCAGEQFAMTSLLLYTANLVQLFKFETWGGTSLLPSMDTTAALGFNPKPYHLRVTSRSQN